MIEVGERRRAGGVVVVAVAAMVEARLAGGVSVDLRLIGEFSSRSFTDRCLEFRRS